MSDFFQSITGIKIGTTCAGIKQTQRDDLVIFELAPQSTCAAVFTQNAFCAAPVILARQHLQSQMPRFLLINSGNANAGTGEQGIQDAYTCCQQISQLTQCKVTEVLPFSTGVIGQPLPVTRICKAIPNALNVLYENAWEQAARAIMTTDTVPKIASMQRDLQGQTVTVTGIAKGAGMIRPNMATMLAFIATDAQVSTPLLQTVLNRAVAESFNRITVDGDTSTNDACVLIATGQGSLTVDDTTLESFCQLVTAVCVQLAQAIVRDGEGATKFITIQVEQGLSEAECLAVAYTIAHSPLVKTALFASDPNWGRILAAVGRSELENLSLNTVHLYLGNVCVVANGSLAINYTEAQGQQVLKEQDILIRVCLGRGHCQAQIWTCDFSYDYVRINAEYRT